MFKHCLDMNRWTGWCCKDNIWEKNLVNICFIIHLETIRYGWCVNIILGPETTLPTMPVLTVIILPEKNYYKHVQNSFLWKQRTCEWPLGFILGIFFELEISLNQGVGPQLYWILVYSIEESQARDEYRGDFKEYQFWEELLKTCENFENC